MAAVYRAVTDTTLLSVLKLGTEVFVAGAGETVTVLNATAQLPAGVPLKHVKVVAGDLVEMTAPEKATVDATLTTVEASNTRQQIYRVSGSPTVDDDESKGHIVDDIWVDISTSPITRYIADDVSDGAAVWSRLLRGRLRPPEVLASQVIIGTDTPLTDQLTFTPLEPAEFQLWQNSGLLQQGAGFAYTLSGKIITILASSGTASDMDTSDTFITGPYRSSD